MSEMTKCPKCSGAEISGPRFIPEGAYVFGPWRKESLRYTCFRCGYHEDHPPHDEEQRRADLAELRKAIPGFMREFE